MRSLTSILERNALSAGIALLVIVVGVELARPFQSASIAFDSQATVLYFNRIVTGQHLEAFVPTTPKPLLSVVFGTLFSVTHDWRSLAWLTLAVDALAVAAAAALARRFGGIAAAAFVGVALANNTNLLFDVGYALATPYALLGLAVAGLAVARERPRFATAGLALCCSALFRVETLVLAGVLVVALGGSWYLSRRARTAGPPVRAWLVPGFALVALPIMMLHDALLTGDPLAWTRIAAEYSAHTPHHVGTALDVLGVLARRYLGMGAVSLLALVGFVHLVVDRRFWLATAIVGLGPGVAGFLVFLGLRHIIVPIRYTALIDIAVIFAAGIGLTRLSAGLERPAIARMLGAIRDRGSGVAVAVAAGAIALVLTQPYFLADPALRQQVRTNLRVSIAEDRAVPVLRTALVTSCAVSDAEAKVLVPGSVWPRAAVDLGLTLREVGVTAPGRLDVAAGYPAPCQLVLHIRDAEAVTPAWAILEVSRATQTGGRTVAPQLADPVAGVWVDAIR